MISRADRRRFLVTTCAALAGAALLVATACGPARPSGPESVLLITLDTLRADHVTAYAPDSPVPTPHLDALGQSGAIVRRAWSPVPLTTPSHASILTGLYPPGHGVRNNARFRLPDDVTTLAEVLRARGLETGAFTAAFTTSSLFGLAQGFATYDDDLGHTPTGAMRTSRPGDEVLANATRWLETHAKQPFFLWVHFFDPHTPYAAPGEWGRRYARDPYAGEVAFTDHLVGELLATLDRLGASERTVVVALADHGEGLGTHGEDEHGLLLYEEVLHVPFFVRAPGKIAPGTVIEGPASVVDVVPTVAGLLGVPWTEPLHGLDLLAADAATLAARRTYAETLYPFEEFGWSAIYATRERDMKLLLSSERELYDLAADPREGQNLAAERPADADALQTALREKATSIVNEDRLATAAGFEGGSDPETIARLESLGYVAGGSGGEGAAGGGGDVLPALTGRSPRVAIGDYETFDRAGELMRAGEHGAAAALLAKLVDNDPGNPQFLLKLAQSQESAGDEAAAEASYRALVDRFPTFYLGYRSYSTFLESRERPLESRALWLRLQGMLPGFVGIDVRLAQAETLAGLPGEAIKRLTAHLDERPDDAGAWSALGEAHEKAGDAEAALGAFRKALALRATERAAVEGATRVLIALGRGAEARELLEALLKRAPDDPLLVHTLRTLPR